MTRSHAEVGASAATGTKPVPTGAMATQPVITITAITSFVSAIFVVLTLTWPDLDPQWEQAAIGVIAAAWPIITAAWTWHKVYSPATAQRVANDAASTGVAADTNPPPPSKGVNVPKEQWGTTIKQREREGKTGPVV